MMWLAQDFLPWLQTGKGKGSGAGVGDGVSSCGRHATAYIATVVCWWYCRPGRPDGQWVVCDEKVWTAIGRVCVGDGLVACIATYYQVDIVPFRTSDLCMA